MLFDRHCCMEAFYITVCLDINLFYYQKYLHMVTSKDFELILFCLLWEI